MGSTVYIEANSASTKASTLSISMTVADSYAGYSNDPFPTPSFSASNTSFAGGDTTIYDSGSVTVKLTSTSGDSYGATLATSTAVPWQSSSTGNTLASAVASAVTNMRASGNVQLVTGSVDDTGGSVNIASVNSGSGDNYGVEVNVTDSTSSQYPTVAPAQLPATSFNFYASSTTGAGGTYTSYGPVYTYTVPAGGYAANGNLLAHSDTVMGDWAFQYDTLNRLTGAAPADNAPTPWKGSLGCWAYDGFSNRTVNAWIAAGDCKTTLTATSSYNTHNQVTFVNQATPIAYSAPSGFVYDGAGNVTTDGQNSYAYDGEGRLCAVKNLSGSFYGYIYDAAGTRVAKGTVNSLSCNLASNGFSLKNQYLLDQGGNQVTELDGVGNWIHSNVWAGAHLDATYDPKGQHFHLADPLGTRRIQTNIYGVKEESFQSLPFGDGYLAVSAGLSTSDDATENHFTGKERDTESGNDYFEARYYASSMGRFMSPDWSAQEEPVPYAHLDNPQSLNLYSYVLNNPLAKADLDGHGCPPDCSTGNDLVDFLDGAANAFTSDNALGAGRMDQSTGSGQLGQAVGDFGAAAVGAGEFLLGTGGNIGGLALDATGVGAIVGVPTNVVSTAAMAQGGAAAVEGVGHLLFSKRTGDFTPSEQNAIDSKNKAQNGGTTKCSDCGQDVRSVANKTGEPTPPDQLQRHHDPQLKTRGPRKTSSKDRILCPACHKKEHARLRANGQ